MLPGSQQRFCEERAMHIATELYGKCVEESIYRRKSCFIYKQYPDLVLQYCPLLKPEVNLISQNDILNQKKLGGNISLP
jgi:hypothetical protein